ncbi:MAG: ABC transporter permease subunit, partial [Anaerolineales bacterium]|nr:ABC transporter permease subunit [Anaerolineales bacterium]
QDPSFIIGGLIVALLLLLAVLGPELAPYNPYIRSELQMVDGVMKKAPIDPCPTYPLGTNPYGVDMISLLLYGAQTTLMIAVSATIIRVMLGLILGSLAGWFPGSVLDRIVVGLIEFLAAIPSIILAIIVLLAIGIRTGQIAFIIALSVVGWGEIAQIIRSHVLSIRNEEFIQAAKAVGLTTMETLSRHVLPNLTATVVTMAALEAGSALLLLSEIGLIEIFIGGGFFIPGDPGTPSVTIPEIPEWGALIGTNWRYFQARPWLTLSPAVAFFIAILGFNLLGYGLQRFIKRGRFYPSGVSVFRFMAVVVVILFGIQYTFAHTGPETEYKPKSEQFDVTRAWGDIAYFTNETYGGRTTGTAGAMVAASYIEDQFEEQGLTPLMTGSYQQLYRVSQGRITTVPELHVGGDDEYVYTFSDGVAFDPYEASNSHGSVETETAYFVVNPVEYPRFYALPGGSMLVFGETTNATSRLLIIEDEAFPSFQYAPPFIGPASFLGFWPQFVIKRSLAAELLARQGYDLDQLEVEGKEYGRGFIKQLDFPMEIFFGMEYEYALGENVIGYIPGSDARIQTNRILVVADYAGPAAIEGDIYPGADDNASGVSVMLEVIRLWNEQAFTPKRTVVFMATSESGAAYFTQEPILTASENDNWTVVILEGLAAGEPDLSIIQSDGNLARMFLDSAKQMKVDVNRGGEYDFFFLTSDNEESWGMTSLGNYVGIVISRPGDELSGGPQDFREHLNPAYLEDAGKVISHFLMMLSSP